jgi:hypothetical protein
MGTEIFCKGDQPGTLIFYDAPDQPLLLIRNLRKTECLSRTFNGKPRMPFA